MPLVALAVRCREVSLGSGHRMTVTSCTDRREVYEQAQMRCTHWPVKEALAERSLRLMTVHVDCTHVLGFRQRYRRSCRRLHERRCVSPRTEQPPHVCVRWALDVGRHFRCRSWYSLSVCPGVRRSRSLRWLVAVGIGRNYRPSSTTEIVGRARTISVGVAVVPVMVIRCGETGCGALVITAKLHLWGGSFVSPTPVTAAAGLALKTRSQTVVLSRIGLAPE